MRATLILVSFLVLHLASCATAPKKAASTYAGTWNVTVNDTPLGTVAGELMITDTDGKLGGKFTFDGRSYPLEYVRVTETGMATEFYYSDQDIDVNVVLDGPPTASSLTGRSLGEYLTTATRKE